jgi:hypothetical protein
MDEKQRQRFREALDKKERKIDPREQTSAEASSLTAHERQLLSPEEDQDSYDVRAKSRGHGKKTADKWNQ